jgi:thiol-disulfide isomerase/thioredoxin
MKRVFLYIICVLCMSIGIQAQDYDALNRYMTKYSSNWPHTDGLGSKTLKQIGTLMPTYSFNSKLNSKALKGKFVVLNYWATWCGGCRLLSADLDSLMIKSTDEYKDVQLIGVDALETLANKGYKAKQFWKEKRFGYPMVDGKAADDCCKSIEAGHPTAVLVDGEGIIRGRWDAWSPGTASEIRLAVWALHIVPEQHILSDVVTLEKFYRSKEYDKALYLLETMPEDTVSIPLRLKTLIKCDERQAVDYLIGIQAKYEVGKSKEQYDWSWRPSAEYVSIMRSIGELIYQSDIENADLLKGGCNAIRIVLNAGNNSHFNYVKLGGLYGRYGKAMYKKGASYLKMAKETAIKNNTSTAEIAQLEKMIKDYGVAGEEYRENEIVRSKMEQDQKEEAEHKQKLAEKK